MKLSPRNSTILLILSLTLSPINLQSAPPSSTSTFWWSFFVPGGGYFYLKEPARGASYFAGTSALIGWGLAVENQRSSDELNTPFLYAQQLHTLQIYGSYRESIRRTLPANSSRKILRDKTAPESLALSPFKKENLKSPWVIGFALLGCGLNYASARLDGVQKDHTNIHSVRMLGQTYNRETGLAMYHAYWLPVSLGAGVSEESIFRGIIQSEWEEQWGAFRGLTAASVLFGAAHYDGHSRSAGNMLFAAVAGMYLGWRYQKTNYQLSQSIAAHFWFDLLAGSTIYLTDPENNPLGAKMEFSF